MCLEIPYTCCMNISRLITPLVCLFQAALSVAKVRWVCATCGGDHRTKSCPHATGMLSVGVQSGMQMLGSLVVFQQISIQSIHHCCVFGMQMLDCFNIHKHPGFWITCCVSRSLDVYELPRNPDRWITILWKWSRQHQRVCVCVGVGAGTTTWRC